MKSDSLDTIQAIKGLEAAEYVRERVDPRPGDWHYLHLSDLRLALDEALPPPHGKVLDYGCGGSPYRQLFQADTYHRADIPGIENLDYVFQGDSKIGAPSDAYDAVLSTQVLEHVKDYRTYLTESRRILRPGGRLILTTHGVFPDHGCPYDFRRWTADGLRLDLAEAGFVVRSIKKLTVGPRALAFLNQQHHRFLLVSRPSLMGLIWRLGRLPYRVNKRWADELCDREYPGFRAVSVAEPDRDLYIALIAVAEKI